MLAEDVPVLRGGLGTSRGRQAVKIQERIRRGAAATQSRVPEAAAAAIK